MILIFPEEIKKLEEIYGPYMINCKLKEDAPQEAIDAFEKEGEWIHEQYRLAGMEWNIASSGVFLIVLNPGIFFAYQ